MLIITLSIFNSPTPLQDYKHALDKPFNAYPKTTFTMQIKALLLTPLLAAGIVSAAPQQPTNTFELLALRNGSPIHFSGVQASESRLTLKKAKQGASCTAGPADNHAIFELLGENLYLYDKPRRQQMWVDRSGMGQGILGYSTGAQSLGKNFEQTGWKVDKNGNLNFKGSGLIACPSSQKNGPWSIWVSAGVNQPGGNKGCVPFTARAIKNSKPTGCEYSVQK